MPIPPLDVIPALILWILLPVWILAGFLDWICHRKSSIAAHCGPWESLLHLLLLAEAGAALLIGLLLELNEPALALRPCRLRRSSAYSARW